MRSKFFVMLWASAVVAVSCLSPQSVLAQVDQPAAASETLEAPIGKVMTATGTVTVEHAVMVAVQAKLASGASAVNVGDLVYRGDTVQTGRDGRVGITFMDGTAFNLSPNARMVLNEFVYDPNGKSNSTLFSLTKGSFTFVAGAIAKTGDMKLDTPVATMGIRGTTPHVEIFDDGTVRFATLVEENKAAASDQSGTSAPNIRPPAPPADRRATSKTRTGMSPEEAARYNRLFNLDIKICRNC